MSRLRLFYLASLVILGALLISIVLHIPQSETFSEVQRSQVIQSKDAWILQFDIINNEGKAAYYTINTSVNGKL